VVVPQESANGVSLKIEVDEKSSLGSSRIEGVAEMNLDIEGQPCCMVRPRRGRDRYTRSDRKSFDEILEGRYAGCAV
jgi:hypothetical protein